MDQLPERMVCRVFDMSPLLRFGCTARWADRCMLRYAFTSASHWAERMVTIQVLASRAARSGLWSDAKPVASRVVRLGALREELFPALVRLDDAVLPMETDMLVTAVREHLRCCLASLKKLLASADDSHMTEDNLSEEESKALASLDDAVVAAALCKLSPEEFDMESWLVRYRTWSGISMNPHNPMSKALENWVARRSYLDMTLLHSLIALRADPEMAAEYDNDPIDGGECTMSALGVVIRKCQARCPLQLRALCEAMVEHGAAVKMDAFSLVRSFPLAADEIHAWELFWQTSSMRLVQSLADTNLGEFHDDNDHEDFIARALSNEMRADAIVVAVSAGVKLEALDMQKSNFAWTLGESLVTQCRAAKLDKPVIRRLVEGMADVNRLVRLEGNFWGEHEPESALQALTRALTMSERHRPIAVDTSRDDTYAAGDGRTLAELLLRHGAELNLDSYLQLKQVADGDSTGWIDFLHSCVVKQLRGALASTTERSLALAGALLVASSAKLMGPDIQEAFRRCSPAGKAWLSANLAKRCRQALDRQDFPLNLEKIQAFIHAGADPCGPSITTCAFEVVAHLDPYRPLVQDVALMFSRCSTQIPPDIILEMLRRDPPESFSMENWQRQWRDIATRQLHAAVRDFELDGDKKALITSTLSAIAAHADESDLQASFDCFSPSELSAELGYCLAKGCKIWALHSQDIATIKALLRYGADADVCYSYREPNDESLYEYSALELVVLKALQLKEQLSRLQEGFSFAYPSRFGTRCGGEEGHYMNSRTWPNAVSEAVAVVTSRSRGRGHDRGRGFRHSLNGAALPLVAVNHKHFRNVIHVLVQHGAHATRRALRDLCILDPDNPIEMAEWAETCEILASRCAHILDDDPTESFWDVGCHNTSDSWTKPNMCYCYDPDPFEY